MAYLPSRNHHRANIWPGFVDALATLLMVIIFLLMIFVIAQFFLNDALSGRDKALESLKGQVSELANLLNLERQTVSTLTERNHKLSLELEESISLSDTLSEKINLLSSQTQKSQNLAESRKISLENALETIQKNKKDFSRQMGKIKNLRLDIIRLTALRDELEQNVRSLILKNSDKNKQLVDEKILSKSAMARIALLNRQIGALKRQMSTIANLLERSEQEAKKQRLKIVNLGKRLNLALASKVQELSRYRSEFFGRLRDVMGNTPGIQVVGDRFVFQSEVLFRRGSDGLEKQGIQQIKRLAVTLKKIGSKIPNNIDWILRVDGHTDQIPIKTGRFPSNWELSAARAISVVQLLIDEGIAPANLAATGFGEFQPISTDKNAYIKNRRIELKLTQR